MIRLLSLMLLACTAVLEGATVRLECDQVSVAVGDTVSVTVSIDDLPATTSWNVLLRYDPALLRLTAQAPAANGQLGTFVPDGRSAIAIAASGVVRAGGMSLTPVTGTGRLATFTFRAQAAGHTGVATEAWTAGHRFGDLLVRSGRFTVPEIGPPVALAIGGPVGRSIAIAVTDGTGDQRRQDLDLGIIPAAGTVDEADGITTFAGLDAGVAHTITIAVMPVANQ